MYKMKMSVFLLFFALCIFTLLSSVSAADFYVNNDTTHKNITDWMKNNAKSGDKLVFNTSSYELEDTIVINKKINVVSYKNTQINFRKHKDMFNVKSNSSFRGLTLNHHEDTFMDVIYSSSRSYIKVNINNVNIRSFGGSVISIYKWVGEVNNCNIYAKASYSSGISSTYGKVNITNSKINSDACSIYIGKWRGNLINSKIISGNKSPGIQSYNWQGNIIGTKIYSNKGQDYGAAYLGLSKGTIKNSVIRLNDTNYALRVTDDVKIIKSSISSITKFKSIYRFRPDLSIKVSPIDYKWRLSHEKGFYLPKKGSYKVTIYNTGYKTSKSCYLSFKTMNISKKYYVKSLKSGAKTAIKINFNSKYMTEEMNIKYPKVFKVDCYNKIKEENKWNNEFIIDKWQYIDKWDYIEI